MMSRRRTHAQGLTLVEFLFATSIMAFVALGVAGMFPAALRSVVVGGQVTKATASAQQMADMLRAEASRVEGFDSLITVYNGQSTTGRTCSASGNLLEQWQCALNPTAAQDTGQGLPAGVGTIAVTCLNTNGDVDATIPCSTDLRRLTVTVTWDRTGSRTVSVVTNVARPN